MVVTVTLAWALALVETFTWKFPVPLVGAVYSPMLLIIPRRVDCQVKSAASDRLAKLVRTAAVNC